MANAVLQRLVDERDQINRDIDHINEAAVDEDRDPSESERGLISRHRDRLALVEPMVVEQLELEEQRQASRDASAVLQRARARASLRRVPTAATAAPAGAEPIDRTFAQHARDQLIVRYDQIAQRAGPGSREAALERIQRVVANTTTTTVAGLVPPQYMTEI